MIHHTAIVHPDALVSPDAVIGPYCMIGSNHGPLVISGRAVIRSHTIIEGGSRYGPGLETGHHVLLRTDNTAGEYLRVGSYSSLEGGGWLGDYVRIHGRCEMTSGTIHDFARIYGGTYITDMRRPPDEDADPCMIGAGAVVCMGVIIVAGVSIGRLAYVAGGAIVTEGVPDRMILTRKGELKPLRHPWTENQEYVEAAYPAAAWSRIAKL